MGKYCRENGKLHVTGLNIEEAYNSIEGLIYFVT